MVGRDIRNNSAMCKALAGHLRSLVILADLYRPEDLRKPGSVAHDELREEARFVAEGWGPRPVAAAEQDVMLRVGAHLDHLVAYAHRVEHDFVTPYALESIARGAIECAARVAWLLDATDVDDRVARWAADKLHSDVKEREAYGWLTKARLPGQADPPIDTSKIDARIDTYRTAAEAAGVELPTVPPYWQQVRDLMKPMGNLAPAPGAFYAMLSAVAHGEEWGLRMLVRLASAQDPTAEIGTVDLVQDDRRVAFVAAFLLCAHEGVITRLAMVLGRPPGHEQWEGELLKARLAIRPGLPGQSSTS